MANTGICNKCNTSFRPSDSQGFCGGVYTTFICDCSSQPSEEKPVPKDVELKINILNKNIEKLKRKAFEARMESERAMEALFAAISPESNPSPSIEAIEARLDSIEREIELLKKLLVKPQENTSKVISG